PKDLPRLYSGTITITQQNVPLAGASVFLTPTDGSKWNAGGTTDAKGKAILYTLGRYKGVSAGNYKVTVDKYEIGSEKPNAEAIYRKTGNYPVPDAYSFVDLKYTDLDKTPLNVVISEKNQSFSFDLGPNVHVLLPH
ncbi:MAG: carboxypeptidase-like regulatory domain-containing protein, partial [Planctomycetaceae bacterium]|nr:carboxypeptidase-like regulatory domain-containing protein [Planctomycetaceae bacterium]